MSRFELELAPVREGRKWAGFEVSYRAELESVAAGELLFSVPERIVSIPGTPYVTEDLHAADEHGTLPLVELEASEDSSGRYRRWAADRDLQGALQLRFFAPVRPHDKLTPVGPLFDLRAEDLGLFGAGITFLPLPGEVVYGPGGPEFDISLTWRLENGVRAISSHGAGDAEWQGPLSSVSFALYGAGEPQTITSGGFSLQAFAETPFELEEVAEYAAKAHAAFAEFFEDEAARYAVLVRKNLGKGTGGTAFPDSFAFGFSAVDETSAAELRSLLAHETAHNWPTLHDDHQKISWYTEGTAEYYSHVLPLRAGFLSAQDFAAQLTDRFQGYDSNALRTLDSNAASASYWSDPRAQRIPYGRGLRYLIATDLQLRAATDGVTSLDDIVLDILRTQRTGELVGVDGWLSRVTAVLGSAAEEHFRSMHAGDLIELSDTAFEGIVRPVPVIIDEYELGFDPASYRSEGRRIAGLRDGSRAALAGLREGDELVDHALPYHAVRRSDREIAIAVIRDGEPLSFTYLPAGESVQSVRWEVQS